MKTVWTRRSAACSLLFKRTDIVALSSEAERGELSPSGGGNAPSLWWCFPPLRVTLLYNLNASLLHLASPDTHIGDTALPQYSYKPSESHRDLLKLCKEPHFCQTLASPNTSWALPNCGRRVRADVNGLVFWRVFSPLFLLVCLNHT